MAWAMIVLGLVLMQVPRTLVLQLLVPAQTIVLAPLRLGTTLHRASVVRRSDHERLMHQAAQLAVENARLRTLSRLAAYSETSAALVAAPIIARDVASMRRYLVVSRGSRHGVRPGMPALAAEGLVGKVVAVGEHQSLVQTILDPESRVAVRLRSSGAVGLLRTDRSGRCLIDFVEPDAIVEAGDTAVTSGLGGTFPAGLNVGRVAAVGNRPAELFLHIQLKPFINLARLEQVFLLRLPMPVYSTDDPWLDNLRPTEVPVPGER